MTGMLSQPLAKAGFIVVAFFTLVALFAPWIAPYDPQAIDLTNPLDSPSRTHLFGTDQLGRDLFSRMVFGARISLSIGFVAVGIATVVGIFFGSIAAYFGGKIDSVIMRFVDLMLCIPTFFLILTVIAILEPNIFNIMAVIGITSWMGIARLIRAEILSLKEREFVQAARAVGASHSRILFRHLIPNALSPVLVSATLGVGSAVLVESSLSFLGIGVQPPTPSWGNILTDAKATLGSAWWIMFFPGTAIFITVLGYNLLGEGIRESLEPRSKSK